MVLNRKISMHESAYTSSQNLLVSNVMTVITSDGGPWLTVTAATVNLYV